ncbi:TetR/AcrR family transcriptional regulator, partial [Streptomyces sp. NPDC058861]|uniref:TetR/AcrR family transcriptional regulator n=1 Tax=Streptomyces sp. NPDC058861 TaxID=3346653 RepID=UPI0036D01F6B
MARTKEFDPDAALRAALELFWARGYEATTMADLVEHLGVGRASLYATFGNKHELYLKALDRYTEANDPRLVEELSAPGPALPAVRALVRRFAAEAATDGERLTGGLVTNT